MVGSLRAHQWLILLIVACVLIAGIDWGLPNCERSDLLSSPSGLGDSLLTELDTAVGSYFSTRDAADKRAAQALRAGNVPTPYAAPLVPAVLDRTERLQAVRRYVVSSCATDERETYIALARMKPAHLDLNPRGFMYGGAYLYPVGATLAFLQTLKVIHPNNRLSDNLKRPDLVRRIYVSGRSLSLLAFLGVMVLLAQLGTRMDRVLTGTFAMVLVFSATLSCSNDSTKPPSVVSDDIMGLWRETTSSSLLSISQTVFRPGYVGAWVDGGPDTCAFSRFELEVAVPPARFMGRHWRCPADSSQWSDSNMVCLELADRNHFRLQYLDVDGDGWNYVRVPIR